MSSNQQIQEAVELREQGFSIREIASQLNLSKSTVDRMLKSYDNANPDEILTDILPGTAKKVPQGQVDSELAYELGKLRLEYNHIETMADKKLHEKEIALQELKQQLKNRKQILREREMDLEHEIELEKENRNKEMLEGRKRTFLNRFKKLIKELKDSSQGYYWDIDDVESFLDKVEDLQESIEDFCDENSIDYEKLAVWDTLSWISELIELTLDDYENKVFQKGTIEFNFDEEDVAALEESLEISAFEEICEDEDIEQDGEELKSEDDWDGEDYDNK